MGRFAILVEVSFRDVSRLPAILTNSGDRKLSSFRVQLKLYKNVMILHLVTGWRIV